MCLRIRQKKHHLSSHILKVLYFFDIIMTNIFSWDDTLSNVFVSQLSDMLPHHEEVLKEFPFMYVSEAIGEDYKQWRDGDYVFIDAPTGTGKTTFIYEKIIVKALEDDLNVLLISNRIALNMQQKRKIYDIINEHKPEALGTLKKDKINKNTIFIGPVCVITYQSLYSIFSSGRLKSDKNGKKVRKIKDWTSKLRYAVFDEIHFLYADAEFNSFCGYLVNYIPYVFKQVIRIYITATSWDIIDYIQKYEESTYKLNIYNPIKQIKNERFNILSQEFHFHHHIIKPDYSKYELKFFDLETSSKAAIAAKLVPGASDNDSLISKAKLQNKRISKAAAVLNIMDPPPSKDNKWIVFVDSKDEGKALKKLLKEAGVSAAYVDRDTSEPQKVRNDIIQYEKFSQPVLITTQVLDNGINICDEAVKNIVVFYTDRTEFIQALGRKRLLNKEAGITIWAWVPSVENFSRRWARYAQNVLLALSIIYSAEALSRIIAIIMHMGMDSPNLLKILSTFINDNAVFEKTFDVWEKVLTKDTLDIIMSFSTSPEFNDMKQHYIINPPVQSKSISDLIYQEFQSELTDKENPKDAAGIHSLLSRTIYMYLSIKGSIEKNQRNEIVKSLFYIEKMGLYSVNAYTLGVVAKKADFLKLFAGSYKWTIAEWLDKNISGQILESSTNAKINKDRMLSEVIKALDDNVDKPLTVDEFSPIKCKIVQTHIQHLGIRPITKRRDRWEGYSAKSVNKLLSDLSLNYSTTKSKKLWLIHKISTEN